MKASLSEAANQLFENASVPLARMNGTLKTAMDTAIDELKRLKPNHYAIPLFEEWKAKMLGEVEQAQDQITATKTLLREQD